MLATAPLASTVLPWRDLCVLRPEVLHGTLEDSEFAADLYNVSVGVGPEVYHNPHEFFNRTYPALALKEVVRDVLQRLAGVGGQPVVRLQVSYGGGKTHSLITLLHLAQNAAALRGNPTVGEFLAFAGIPAPQARVALLPFDKLDIHHGIEVTGPSGNKRTVMTPWGALAYQLADEAGYALVLPHEQGYTTPAETVLRQLLEMSLADGKAPLILLDEVVNYCSDVALDKPDRLSTLQNFFQYLTQAVSATKRACMVFTLLDAGSVVYNAVRSRVLAALEDVFGRNQSVRVPIGDNDIAVLLRRRLFESVPDDATVRNVASAMLSALNSSPKVRPEKKGNDYFNRLVHVYPFHPDLIQVFYEKWTDMAKFQRTRSAIRLLATALRDAAPQDPAPLVGVSAFLGSGSTVSTALRELALIASAENDIWSPKLNGELERAWQAQAEVQTLTQREVEQGVLAAFLHSQPQPHQKAEDSDLHTLLIHPGVDMAGLEAGLGEWRKRSWFLSEEPLVWRLMTEANLNKIHQEEIARVATDKIAVADRLKERIQKEKTHLVGGVDAAVQAHFLPTNGPGDVGDDTDLHYIVLHPDEAVEPANIPPAAAAYFKVRTGPRTFVNTLIALAPQKSLVEGLRGRIIELLAWERVASSDIGKRLTPMQTRMLADQKNAIEKDLPEQVRAAYNFVLDRDISGSVRAQVLATPASLNISDTRPYARIKKMLENEQRLITEPLLPDLLLPESPFDLWTEEEARKGKTAKALFEMFAQFPDRPRFLSVQTFFDSLMRGCDEGLLVLEIAFPDGSNKSFWRKPPTSDKMSLDLRVIPIAAATLPILEPDLLAPNVLPGLWALADQPILRRDIMAYFDGQQVPALTDAALTNAIREAVARGILWARTAGGTYFKEQMPETAITDNLELLTPPLPVYPADLFPDALPSAWDADGTPPRATLAAIADALSAQRGYSLPWPLLAEAITAGLQTHRFTVEGVWPCGPEGTAGVTLTIAETVPLGGSGTPKIASPGSTYTAPGATNGSQGTLPVLGTWTEEKVLSLFEMQRLGEVADQLGSIAPALKIGFKVLITAEGSEVDAATKEALNAVLAQATNKLRFE